MRLIECETMVDHVHLLIETRNYTERTQALHLLKGSSAHAVLQAFPDIKLDEHVNHFWQKRYRSRQVQPKEIPAVRAYIRSQKDRPDKYAR